MAHVPAQDTEGMFVARGQTRTEGCPFSKARLYKALRFMQKKKNLQGRADLAEQPKPSEK